MSNFCPEKHLEKIVSHRVQPEIGQAPLLLQDAQTVSEAPHFTRSEPSIFQFFILTILFTVTFKFNAVMFAINNQTFSLQPNDQLFHFTPEKKSIFICMIYNCEKDW